MCIGHDKDLRALIGCLRDEDVECVTGKIA